MKLRPYQEKAIEALYKEIKANKKTLLCLPTGAGKTFTAATFTYRQWIKNKSKVVFWTAHLQELLDQAEETFKKIDSNINMLHWNAKEKPDTKLIEPGTIVFCSILSTKSLKWDKGNCVLIIDEAHREAARSYRNFENRLKPDYKVGLTATPHRFDKKPLGFDSVSYSTTLMELANEGYLSKPQYIRVVTKLKFDLKTNNSDFTKESLVTLGKNNNRVKIVAQEYINNKDKYGQTLIFMPSVKSAKAVAKILTKEKINCKALDGTVDKNFRKLVVDQFNKGDLEVLINVQLFTEGFDAPETKTIFMARPTLSNVLWAQAAGRGARKTKKKDTFYFVDFLDDISKYPLLAEEWSYDLLGQEPSETIVKKKGADNAIKNAKDKVKTKKEKNLVLKLYKEFKVQDLVAICNVVYIKRDKEYTESLPIFKNTYAVFKTFSSLMYQYSTMSSFNFYDFIFTSYERGGYKSELSRDQWHKFSWALKKHFDKQINGKRISYNPITNNIIDNKFKKPNVDFSIFDLNTSPLNVKEIESYFNHVCGKIPGMQYCFSFVKLDYKTIFITSTGGGPWYYNKGKIDKLQKAIQNKFKDNMIWIKVIV